MTEPVIPQSLPMRSGVRERLLAMRSTGLFDGLDDEGATLLAENSRIASFEAGARLSGLEGVVESVHVVLEGRIHIESPDGRVMIFDAGRAVGLVGIFGHARARPTSIAEVRTRTLEFSREAFLAALEENFSLMRGAYRVIATALLDLRGELPPAVGPAFAAPMLRTTRPRTLVERALDVSTSALFGDANVDAVFDVARNLDEVHVPAGHVFWRRKDPAQKVLRVFSGLARCTDAKGNSVLVGGNDVMLGNLAAFTQRPHLYDVVAETDVSAYQMGFEEFLVVLETHPELAMRLLANMTESIAEAAGMLAKKAP